MPHESLITIGSKSSSVLCNLKEKLLFLKMSNMDVKLVLKSKSGLFNSECWTPYVACHKIDDSLGKIILACL